MQRQSKMAQKLINSAHGVEDSIDINGGDIADRLAIMFPVSTVPPGPEEPEEEGPNLSFQVTLSRLQGGLAGSRRRLAAVDQHHVENVRHYIEVRNQHYEINRSVYAKFGTARRTIEDNYPEGHGAFVLAGFEGPSSPQTPVLVRQADVAIDRLKSPDLVLPKPRVAGIQVDPVAIAAELEPEVEELRESHDELRLARREVEKSRKEKNRVLDEHEQLFLRVSRVFENYYLLAGEPELAAQIRPSGHRPGRRAVEVEDEVATSPESPSEESPAATTAS